MATADCLHGKEKIYEKVFSSLLCSGEGRKIISCVCSNNSANCFDIVWLSEVNDNTTVGSEKLSQ